MAIRLSPSLFDSNLTFGSKAIQFVSTSSLRKLVISSNSCSSYVHVHMLLEKLNRTTCRNDDLHIWPPSSQEISQGCQRQAVFLP